jgi:hypothetical protein
MSTTYTTQANTSRTRRKKRNPLLGLSIGLLVSAALLVWLTSAGDLSAGAAAKELAWPLTRILLLVGVGLIVGQVVEATGWTRHLARLAGPMFRFANLGSRCGAAFTTAFFSGVAANAMLVDTYREGNIDKGHLFLTNFVNHFPAFFLHLPTTLFIVLPLAGLAGGIYMGLVLSAVILRTCCFLLVGRLFLSPPSEPETQEPGAASSPREGLKNVAAQLRDRVPRRFLGIVQYVVPIYIFVYTLTQLGAFDALRQVLSGTAVGAVFPVESLSMVIIAFLADYTSGFATAGALLENGVLGLHQGALALLLGNVVAFPVRALRHQLPRYLGIYTPGMGTQILLLGQLTRVLSLLIVGGIYGLFTLPFAV